MKLNTFERWFVNSPVRQIKQHLVMQWFKRTVALQAGTTILEIGCGRGVGARLICETYHPNHLYLLDLDPVMIKKASRRLNGKNKKPISFCVGDAARLPIRDDSLDAVFGFGFLHHVPAWRDGLAEVTRVLKRGGVYFMEEYYPSLYQNFLTKHIVVHPDKDRFNSQDLYQAFQSVGLTLTHTFELKRMGILGVGVKAGAESISCEKNELSVEVVSEMATRAETEGANAIFLMGTGDYPFEKFIEISEEIRTKLNSETVMIANIGDFGAEAAQQLKDAGYKGIYHAVRMGEGLDTHISPETRLQTVRNAKEPENLRGNGFRDVGGGFRHL